ncbi:MAG TPA: type II toxin-antitoxin system VapC family toxin [Thermoguttaceae bacterium]|nr:type II toxin-antitoxin system VapC family toxin [Thermoguttaceae bacterium]
MIAFDTDVLTEILLDNRAFVDRAACVPQGQQAIPIVVVEEILRGRLNVIRRAEAGKAPVSIARAYELFRRSLADFARITVLPYTPQAESLVEHRRQQKVRVATHDLRIAAICVDHSATLISRNRRDFDRVPRLSVEYWD